MKSPKQQTHNKNTAKNQSGQNLSLIYILILLSYAFITVVTPNMNTLDSNGPKFYTLAILNLVAYPIMLLHNKLRPQKDFHWLFFKNWIGVTYTLFLLISLLSVFKAFNLYESVINLSKLFTVFSAAYMIAIILQNDKRYTYILSVSLTLLLVIDSVTVFYHLFLNLTESGGINISAIKSIYSNKNILAAAIFVKIAFALWLIAFGKPWMKWLAGITVFLAIVATLFMSTRTFYVGLIFLLITYGVFFFIRYYRKNEKRKLARLLIISSVVIASSFLVFTFTLKYLYPSTAEGTFSVDFISRLKTITQYGGKLQGYGQRTGSWERSFELFKENPLLGVGTGNWKIEVLKYETPLTGAYIYMYKNHNDFIETFADTGIFGGLLFLGIFLLIFANFIRAFFRARKGEEESYKWLFLPAFGLFCYFFDAFFNFPSDRPEIISFFAIFVGAGIAFSPTINNWKFWRRAKGEEEGTSPLNNDPAGVIQTDAAGSPVTHPGTSNKDHKAGLGMKGKQEHRARHATKLGEASTAGPGKATVHAKKQKDRFNLKALPLILLFLALMLGSVYVFYLNFKSLKLQRIIKQELLSGKLTTKSEVFLAGFPKLPDISIEGEPISVSKSRYLVAEGKYREAIDLLKKDNSSPYDTRQEFFLAIAYLNMGNPDSSLIYSRKVYAMKPLFSGNVTVLSNALEAKGDLEGALNVLDRHVKICDENGEPVADNIRQKIAQLTPMIKIRPYEKIYTAALNAFTGKQYELAIKNFTDFISKEPGVAAAFEYRAFSYFYLNDFRRSLDDIEKAIAIDPGKSGFVNLRGINKHFLGDNPGACADFQAAIAMGDKDAPVNYERFCRNAATTRK